MWLRGGRGGTRPTRVSFKSIAIAGVAGALAASLMVVAIMYRENDASTRRDSSDSTRLAGLLFGGYAIANSPIVGYGSWARGGELTPLWRRATATANAADSVPTSVVASTGGVHAQLPQAWVEGGIFAAVFFILLMIEALRRMPFLVLARPLDPLTPLLTYWLVHGLWNFWGSPFSATLRLDLSLMAVAAVIVAADQVRTRTMLAAPRASVRSQRRGPAFGGMRQRSPSQG
jgi:hypothetical protein